MFKKYDTYLVDLNVLDLNLTPIYNSNLQIAP